MNTIKNKIEEIAAVLSQTDLSEITHPGLLAGGSGVACFLFEYAKYANDESIHQKAMQIIDKTIDLVFENTPIPSHCSGLAGIAHFLSDLEERENIDSVISKEIDDYLEVAMLNEMHKDHYDFLHGAVGIAYYFVVRAEKKKKYQRVVKLIVDYLNTSAQRHTVDGLNFVKWKSYNFHDGATEYNISMSHGMSSIVVILTKILKTANATTRKQIIPLLEGAINYILNQQIDKEVYHSYFPYLSLESTKTLTGSRLAWCYGDLGIASAIWQAGIALENEIWKNKALEVLLHTTERRDLQTDMLDDACLCHGTAGVAQVYQRMYLNTGIEKFKETAQFWIQETLKMSKFDDGLAGYKSYQGRAMDTPVDWMNDPGILEGVSGTGLALLASLSNSDPYWDKYFLLS